MKFKICVKKSKKDSYYGVALVEDAEEHSHYLSFDFRTIISLLSAIDNISGDNSVSAYISALNSKQELVVYSSDLLIG